MEMLGIRPGAVSVLAVVNDAQGRVKLMLDRKLANAIAINCHPLSNQRTTSLSQEAFEKFLGATGRVATYINMDEELPPS
jgi:Ala-tRNA(Pro) deacylase